MTPSAALVDYPQSDVPQYVPESGEIRITSNDQYTAVAERLKVITSFRRSVMDFFRPHKERANAAHKALCDDERKVLKPAEADESRLKSAMVIWTNEQDRIRRKEQLRLQEEQRQRDETRRIEEAAALEREAQATGDVGLQEQAEQVLSAPAPVMAVEAATPAAPKVQGISYRETYRAEVTDLMTLVKAVAEGKQPITLLEANQTALDGMARALKSALAIPGVRLVCDKTAVTRTR